MVQSQSRNELWEDTAAPSADPSLGDLGDDPLHGFGSPPETTRHLRRSRDDKVIAGVCGGLGTYLGIDPVLVRIAFVILTIGWGSGVLLYILGWIAIPEAAADEHIGVARPADRSIGAVMVGGVLILAGVTLLVRRILPWFDDRIFWPMVLISIGVLFAMRGVRR